MIHSVGDEMLALSDRGGRLRGQLKVHIHVVNVCCRVYGNDISRKLVFVVQVRPVCVGGNDVGYLFELTEFG